MLANTLIASIPEKLVIDIGNVHYIEETYTPQISRLESSRRYHLITCNNYYTSNAHSTAASKSVTKILLLILPLFLAISI